MLLEASTPRGVLLEPPPRRERTTDGDRFNPSWGPAGTVGYDSQPNLTGWLQPLVGSCWNRAGVVDPHRQTAASTPRGVLLEPPPPLPPLRGSRCFNPSWGPAGTSTSRARSCRRTRFNPSWGPAGTAFRPHRSTARVGFNPSWGPAGTVGRVVEAAGRSVLQPLVGSCWNPSSSITAASTSRSFNPSWGPAGTVRLTPLSEVLSELQPLVGSCWNHANIPGHSL